MAKKKKTYNERFNTRLNDNVLKNYQKHAELFPSLLNDMGDYDTQGFYKNLYNTHKGDFNAITQALTPGSETEHIGTDRFKKPNHPTFSKESKYHIPIFRPGGYWQDNYFVASNRNIRNMNENYGSPMNYMQWAEDYDRNNIPDVGLKYKGETLIEPEQKAYGGKINNMKKKNKNQLPQLGFGAVLAPQLFDLAANTLTNLSTYAVTDMIKAIREPKQEMRPTKMNTGFTMANGGTVGSPKKKYMRKKGKRIATDSPEYKEAYDEIMKNRAEGIYYDDYVVEEPAVVEVKKMTKKQIKEAQAKRKADEEAMYNLLQAGVQAGNFDGLDNNGNYIPFEGGRPGIDGALGNAVLDFMNMGRKDYTDGPLENVLEYIPFLGSALSTDDYTLAKEDLQGENKEGTFNNAVDMAGILPIGKYGNALKIPKYIEMAADALGLYGTAKDLYQDNISPMLLPNQNYPRIPKGYDMNQKLFDYQKNQPGNINFAKDENYAMGGMIKRADGSYSKRGLWDNIRANKGSGKKPTKQMLEQERKIKAAEKAFGGMITPDMYMQQMMYGSYAQGGQVPQNIPVEVEGEEMYEMPNGQVGEFEGPSHEQGGIPIALPEGTEVFSKRLKVNGKSMADRKKIRENNVAKLEKLLNKNPSDKFIREALKRQKETAELEEQSDMAIQQQANQKQQMQEQAQQEQAMMQEQAMAGLMQDPAMMQQMGMMMYGGMLNNTYANGTSNNGILDDPCPEGYVKDANGNCVPEIENVYNDATKDYRYNFNEPFDRNKIFDHSSYTHTQAIPHNYFLSDLQLPINRKAKGFKREKSSRLNTMADMFNGNYMATYNDGINNKEYMHPKRRGVTSVDYDENGNMNVKIYKPSDEFNTNWPKAFREKKFEGNGIKVTNLKNPILPLLENEQLNSIPNQNVISSPTVNDFDFGKGIVKKGINAVANRMKGLNTSKNNPITIPPSNPKFTDIAPPFLTEEQLNQFTNFNINPLDFRENVGVNSTSSPVMNTITTENLANPFTPTYTAPQTGAYPKIKEPVTAQLPTYPLAMGVDPIADQLQQLMMNGLPDQMAGKYPLNPKKPNKFMNFLNKAVDETGDFFSGMFDKNGKPKKEKGTKSDKTKSGEGLDYTRGDLMGMAGTLYGGLAPMTATMLNKMMTPANINFFREFGAEGLRAMQEAQALSAINRDKQLADIKLGEEASRQRGRNSARGVNTLRAMDIAADMTANQAQNQAYNAYAQQMMQLLGQKAQMENIQDQMVMQGETARDLADRQDLDNFYTNLATNFASQSELMQKQGKDINQALYNRDVLKLAPLLSRYGIGVTKDANGEWITYDIKSNTELTEEEIAKILKIEKETKENKKKSIVPAFSLNYGQE